MNPFQFGGVSDPYFSSVVLLCHLDGSNGQTTTSDSSSFAHTMSMTGSTKLDTAQKKFGATSLNMKDASGVGNVESADSTDWSFSNGQFTVEAWIYCTSAPSNTITIIAHRGSSPQREWHLGFFSSTTFGFRYSTTGSDDLGVQAAWTPTLNTWYHVAADRDSSNVLRVYIDGSIHASATVSSTFSNSTEKLQIGNCISAFGPFLGYIDEVRITKGVARYGGAFTPPTAAFPDS